MLAYKGPCIASIEAMRMRLSELQDNDKEVRKLIVKRSPKGQEDIKKIFYYQGFLYIPKIICSMLIKNHHEDRLVDCYGLKKT